MIKIVTPPMESVVTMEEALAHLRVDTTTENALIYIYLQAATEACEGIAHRSFVERVYDFVPGKIPDTGNPIKLPLPPLMSVESVVYEDISGNIVTVPTTDYSVDVISEPGKIIFSVAIDGIPTIRYRAGYGTSDNVPAMYKAAVLLTLAHLYENRQDVIAQQGAGAVQPPNGAIHLLLMNRGWR